VSVTAIQNAPPPDGSGTPPFSAERVLAEEALAIQPRATASDAPLSAEQEKAYDEFEKAVARPPAPDERNQKRGVSDDPVDAAECQTSSLRQRTFYRALNHLDRAALCLSGGGIRSAAFSLGVIQALAAHPRPRHLRSMFDSNDPAATKKPEASASQVGKAAPEKPEPHKAGPHLPENTITAPGLSLLAQTEYLSTVSGGGYIGSWLSAWRLRVGFPTVWNNLVGRPCGPDVEPGTIAWLRAYSNYLSPKLGALSGDTWAGVAISLRNLLLNWLVIVPAICVVLLLLKMIATVSIGIAVYPRSAWIVCLFAGLAVITLGTALRFTTQNRPTRRMEDPVPRDDGGVGVDQGTFLRWDLLPATLAAGALIQLGASNSGLAVIDAHSIWRVIAVAAGIGALVYALSWLLARRAQCELRDLAVWTVSGLIYGALLGTGVFVYNQAPTDGFWMFGDLLLPVLFGVPWILLSQMTAEMVFVGLSSYQPGSDGDREWVGRAAGWYLVTAIGWFTVTFLVFAGSLVLSDFSSHLKTWIAPLGGVGGIVTALIGKSALSPGRGPQAKGAKPLPTSIILAIAAPLFAAALIILLSAALDELLLQDSLVLLLRYPDSYIFAMGWWKMAAPMVGGLLLTGLIAWAADKVIDIRRLEVLTVGWPVLATAAVMLLAAVSDTYTQSAAITRSWELFVPLLLGVAITGLIAWAASRYGRIEIRNRWIFVGAGPLAAAVFVIFVSAVIDLTPDTLAIAPGLHGLGIFAAGWFDIFGPLLVGFVAAGTLAWIASYNININRFSLHAVYRNRLVRAFLGASRPQRNPDAFTGFDEEDNPHVGDLWPKRIGPHTWPPRKPSEWRPFHVINMALNIVSTKRLSWQERKAESFTVSPLHSGSACKAFRRSDEYAGKKGITLGTAMAISGAAASPNMGYNSSPAVTFLMALFNVRLGWWLGNPGEEGDATYRLEGPSLALQPLVEETFGLTTDERPYVYLSDGGHFENLGIYEMVRRRCRYIVAVDAGADPDYGFEDLGNAVRKIAIDLGVNVRFHGLDKLMKRKKKGRDIGEGQPYHAIGEIDYPSVDGGGEHGIILYIKPGYHGVEDAGVRAYATANPTFPHQGTIDQFFSESQFESYRALGFEITDGLLDRVLGELRHKRQPTDLRAIFHHLRDEAQAAVKAARAATAPPELAAHPPAHPPVPPAAPLSGETASGPNPS
jgi:hypothetical protein